MTIEQELKMTNFQSYQHKTALNILFTANWLHARTHAILKDFWLSSEQFNVLRILRGQHPTAICLKNITERMLDRNSNTTRIVEKLVLKNLVLRTQSSEDRRELQILITNEGLATLAKIDTLFNEEQAHIAPNLSEDECTLLNQLLDKIRDI